LQFLFSPCKVKKETAIGHTLEWSCAQHDSVPSAFLLKLQKT